MHYNDVEYTRMEDLVRRVRCRSNNARDILGNLRGGNINDKDIADDFHMTYVDTVSTMYANIQGSERGEEDVEQNDHDQYHDDNMDSDTDEEPNKQTGGYASAMTGDNSSGIVGGSKQTSKSTKRKHPTSKSKLTKNPRSKPITPTLTSTNRFLNNMYIYIRYNKDPNNSERNIPMLNATSRSKRIALTINQYVSMFLRHLNYLIAVKTNVNYNLIDTRQLFIKLPVYVYTNDEAAMHPLDLILHRVESMKQFLESFDFSKDTKSVLWLLRTMTSVGVNINEDFNITVDCDDFNYQKVDEPLTFTFPKLEYPKITKKQLKDKSTITLYEDPYFNDYGIFINLSVTFDEMGLSWNGLHLYEHLMTKGWAKLSVNDQIYANGVTYPTGICMVFQILANEQAFKEYTNAAFEWMFKCRGVDFWTKDVSKEIYLETCRTISETRTERTLSSMGRSDFHAYNNDYNRSIFEYWSNKPFNMLLTVPKGTKGIDIERLNALCDKYPLRQVPRPKNITLKYYPFEVMNMKTQTKLCILKSSIEDIKKALMKPQLKTKAFFGVDCYLRQDPTQMDDGDLSEFISVLHPLLFMNEYFTEEELNRFVRTHITAYSSETMHIQSLCIRHAADNFNELRLII